MMVKAFAKGVYLGWGFLNAGPLERILQACDAEGTLVVEVDLQVDLRDFTWDPPLMLNKNLLQLYES
eukprot:scaffold7295_cov167-Amphora_coffeaeformis.AAC.2